MEHSTQERKIKMIYIITFFVSCVLFYLAESKAVLRGRFFLNGIAIVLPCILAGIRDETVGTDVLVYLKPIYEAALKTENYISLFSENWFRIYRYWSVSDYEIGFVTVVYVLGRIFKSINVIEFTLEFFIVFGVYKTLKRVRNMVPTWFGMLVFYLTLYNVSLNMMRQSIAMVFILYGSTYLKDNNIKIYMVYNTIAFLFHSSAIIGILLFFVYEYVYLNDAVFGGEKHGIRIKSNLFSYENLNAILIFAYSVLLLGGIGLILKVLSIVGITKFVGYINGSVSLLPNQIILRVFPIVIMLCNIKSYTKIDKNASFYFAMLLLDLSASQLASIRADSGRIAYYFSMFNCISYYGMCSTRPRCGRRLLKMLILIYFVVYWYYNIVFSGRTGTYPYTTCF